MNLKPYPPAGAARGRARRADTEASPSQLEGTTAARLLRGRGLVCWGRNFTGSWDRQDLIVGTR